MIALFVFGCAVQHVKSLMLDQESNLCSLQGKHGVLTTGPPGKSYASFFNYVSLMVWLYGTVPCFA